MTDTEIINPDISGPVNIDGEEWANVTNYIYSSLVDCTDSLVKNKYGDGYFNTTVEGRKIYEKMTDLNLEISNNQTRFKSLENEINGKLKSLDRTNSLQIDEYNKLINQFNDLKDSYNNKIVSLNKLINRINFINSSNYIK